MRVSTVFPPPDSVIRAINAATTRIDGRVEIYEQDAVTRWASDKLRRLVDGSISVDYTRDERRTADITLDNSDGVLLNAPGYFWYDKVIKVFKRVRLKTADFDAWECQVGEFMIDSIAEDNFPHHTKITCRDYTKKCQNSKFVVTTEFADPTIQLETLIGAIAANAGIVKMILPVTGITVGQTFPYDPGTGRWDAMKEIANAYNYDVYFDQTGYLRLTPFADPYLQNATYVFKTGDDGGNLISYTKTTDDSRLYNHVLVIGKSTDDSLPVWAEAINTNPASPTNVDEIGDRLFEYDSDLVFRRKNWAENPSFELAYPYNSWNSDVVDGPSDVTSINQVADTPSGAGGTYCLEIKWESGTTDATGAGFLQTLTKHTVVEGDVWSFSIWAKTNRSGQILCPRIAWRDKKDAFIVNSLGDEYTMTAGVWQKLKINGAVAPANADTLYAEVIPSPTDGLVWNIGDYLRVDQLIIELASSVGEYFDGDTESCEWTIPSPTMPPLPAPGPGASTSTSNQMAQTLADTFLSVHQLQQFSLDLSSTNAFYLDAGQIVEFDDPHPAPGDPIKFLLQTLDIPINVGAMSATAARIENVGGT
jgi:hypothetical protein